MIEFFYSIDVALFFFINQSLANPVFDLVLPVLTDLNKFTAVRIFVLCFVVFVIWKGGKNGRIALGLVIVTVFFSDQLNSSFLKDIFGRVRPCRALDGVRMLVDCGGGLSFPSSHAVNNFAAAAVIAQFFRAQRWYWYGFAGIVALSRPYVGVHYPSDIAAGSILGLLIGLSIVAIWKKASPHLEKRFQQLRTK